MRTVEIASALNNQALAVLVNGDERGALITFQRALRCMSMSEFVDHSTTTSQRSAELLAGGLVDLAFKEVNVSLEGLQGDEFFIYDGLIAISSIKKSGEGNGTDFSELCVTLVSSVLLFNIAQMHLRMARLLVPGRASGSYMALQRAVEFYLMSLQLLERASAGVAIGTEGSGVPLRATIHALAILGLNNMAIAYSELKIGKQTRCCLMELSRQLGRSVPAKFSDEESSDGGFLIRKTDIQGIYLNIMKIGHAELAPAA